MADLTGHAAGNGGHSQGTPTAHRALLYSDIDGNHVYQDLESGAHPAEVIVLDIAMPEMNGLDSERINFTRAEP
jgi:CheY-like chemotaxis protein